MAKRRKFVGFFHHFLIRAFPQLILRCDFLQFRFQVGLNVVFHRNDIRVLRVTNVAGFACVMRRINSEWLDRESNEISLREIFFPGIPWKEKTIFINKINENNEYFFQLDVILNNENSYFGWRSNKIGKYSSTGIMLSSGFASSNFFTPLCDNM